MTWRVIKAMDQKRDFLKAWLEKKFYLTDLCKQFGIGSTCAYKLISRFKEEGWDCLEERSRAPHNSPYKTSDSLEQAILALKYERSRWGPKKILGHLQNTFADRPWPSVTTIENILKKHGLVEKRKLKRRLAKAASPCDHSNSSNEVWCMDFKGWWLTPENEKIAPFTLTDSFSRFILSCEKLTLNNTTHVWGVLERLFREYGLPLRIKSDNGPPFASLGPGRLSRLSINLIKAGVQPEWIDPGEPQQNGRHERMHLTLKQEGVDSGLLFKDQKKRLEDFVHYFNFIRPHEALNQKPPSQIYKPSTRVWHGLLRSPEYPNEYRVGKVKNCGKMSWRNREIYIGRVFAGEPIGLKVDSEKIEAYYGPIFLGTVDTNNLNIERRPGRMKLKI